MEQEQGMSPTPEKESKAQERTRIILTVRSGKLTVTGGANLIGISRQCFYEWERRALSAMAEALLDREAGRPETPGEDPEKETLRKKLAALEQEVAALRQSAAVRETLSLFPEWRNKASDPQKKRQR